MSDRWGQFQRDGIRCVVVLPLPSKPRLHPCDGCVATTYCNCVQSFEGRNRMAISVFLADDNLIVREGVKALLDLEDDFEVVGQAADYDGLVEGAEASQPQVVVTDIRMPPDFQREGIDGAKEIRKRLPGTGVVILSQFDDPAYAVSLLAEGAAGYAYLLKDKVGEGNQLARAVREVAVGGSVLDASIVEGLINRFERTPA